MFNELFLKLFLKYRIIYIAYYRFFLNFTFLLLLAFLVSCSSQLTSTVDSAELRLSKSREKESIPKTLSKTNTTQLKNNLGAKNQDNSSVSSKSTSIYPVNSQVFETPISNIDLVRNSERSSFANKLDGFTSFIAHQGQILSLETSKEGREVFTGGADGKLVRSQLIENAKGERVVSSRVLAKSAREILSLSVSPDSKVLAIGQYSSITLLDLNSFDILGQLNRIRGRVDNLVWTEDSKQILFGLSSGKIFSWNLYFDGDYARNSLHALEEYQGANSAIVGLATHPDGKIFFTAEKSGRINVWRYIKAEESFGLREADTDKKELKVSRSFKVVVDLPIEILSFSLSDDSKYLYALTADGALRSWKVRGLKPHKKIQIVSEGISSFSELFNQNLTHDDNSIFAFITRKQKIILLCDAPNQKNNILIDDLNLPSLLRTEVLKNGPSKLISASKRAVIWAAQKDGAILMLDLEQSGIKPQC